MTDSRVSSVSEIVCLVRPALWSLGVLVGLYSTGIESFAETPPVSRVSLQKRVELNPSQKALRLNEIGVELVLKGEKQKGEAALVEASKIDPKNPTIYYNLAGLYLNQGNIPKALEAVNRCIALRPEDLSFVHRLGEIHFAAKNFADAAEVFESIVSKNPNFNEVLFHLGTVYAMQERWSDSEEVLKRALKNYPAHTSLETNLANVLIMQEKFQEAAELLTQAQKREPTAETALALGIAWEGADQKSRALASYQEAARLGSKDEELQKRISGLKGESSR